MRVRLRVRAVAVTAQVRRGDAGMQGAEQWIAEAAGYGEAARGLRGTQKSEAWHFLGAANPMLE